MSDNLYPWLISDLIEKGEWEYRKYFSAPGLIPVIKQLALDDKTPIVGIEIGVASAWNIFNFLNNIPNVHIIGIDPYLPFYDWNSYIGSDILEAQYQAALKNTEQFSERVLIVKDKSENVVDQYPDQSVDYIFVDGDHSSEAVYRDCVNYYNKVRSGGIFSGHDYGIPSVREGLERFRSEGNFPQIATCTDSVWYWVKQ